MYRNCDDFDFIRSLCSAAHQRQLIYNSTGFMVCPVFFERTDELYSLIYGTIYFELVDWDENLTVYKATTSWTAKYRVELDVMSFPCTCGNHPGCQCGGTHTIRPETFVTTNVVVVPEFVMYFISEEPIPEDELEDRQQEWRRSVVSKIQREANERVEMRSFAYGFPCE